VPEDVLCLNKVDLLDEVSRSKLEARYPGAVTISAIHDAGALSSAIREALSRDRVRVRLLIPHAEYGESTDLYGKVEIHSREDTEEGLEMDVTMPKQLLARYLRFTTP
jgi:GTPase